MANITIYEFDRLIEHQLANTPQKHVHRIPCTPFKWLVKTALRISESEEVPWLHLTQHLGGHAIRFNNYVGVIQTPDGYQIEVLPKIGKVIDDGEARTLLIDMIRCLHGFRHIQTESAHLIATKMPLLEVFIGEFLRTVEYLIKRGLRSDYNMLQENLLALRGKLQIANHLKHNLCRADRFFTQYDEFTLNRAENRLIHTALKKVLTWTSSGANQQAARELSFVFAEVPLSSNPSIDFQKLRPDRSMAHYHQALAWARIILKEVSPLTGSGDHEAPSLIFPMESVFEAYVAKHLTKQVNQGFSLQTQSRSHALVEHLKKKKFHLKPDLLVTTNDTTTLVLDTKWKLLNEQSHYTTDKSGFNQGDFYQLYAYGQSYLQGRGDVILIYPKTAHFHEALPVFKFPSAPHLQLWVVPFCLKRKCLMIPDELSPDGGLLSIQ